MEDKLMMDKYGFGYNRNPAAQKRWGDIMETDHDYDGDFLIRLVVHKLELMLDYFAELEKKDKQVANYANDVSVHKIIKTINNVHELGMKILTFNYGEEADKIFEEKGNPRWLIESSEEEDYIEWNRLSEQAEIDRRKDIEKFFKTIGKNIDDWWNN